MQLYGVINAYTALLLAAAIAVYSMFPFSYDTISISEENVTITRHALFRNTSIKIAFLDIRNITIGRSVLGILFEYGDISFETIESTTYTVKLNKTIQFNC